MKRFWNRLFGRTTATTTANDAEKAHDQAAVARQEAERQRMQDEMSLRASRNGIGF